MQFEVPTEAQREQWCRNAAGGYRRRLDFLVNAYNAMCEAQADKHPSGVDGLRADIDKAVVSLFWTERELERKEY